MQSMEVIREWQLDQLRKAVQTLQFVVENTTQQAATTYRDSGDGWTALEVLCHLRDYDALFFDRAKLTMEQDNPDLPNPNQEILADERNYNGQDWKAVFREFADHRKRFADYLEQIAEQDWERPAKHPRRGPFTLHDQLMLTVWHDMNHIEQMTRLLVERRTSQK